jgi:hypothetical protein
MRRILALLLAALAGVSLLTVTAAAKTDASRHPFPVLRGATARFHNVATAEQEGYGLLPDAQGIACIDMPGIGAMGIHWASSRLLNDPAIVKRRPEALVYAPGADGTLELAAVEYVVVKSAWDAGHSARPSLFGHTFNLTAAPNRFGLPAFYSLHVWAWKQNPAGRFAMWNPTVHCQ